MEITVDVHHEDDGYWAEVTEFPGCLTAARTLSELAEMLEDAIRLWLDEPAAALVAPVLAPGTVHLQLSRLVRDA